MEDLKDWLRYEPETGKIFRTKSKWGSKVGEVTTTNGSGYIVVKHNGKMLYGHHIAWYFTYGYKPKMLDHINRNRTDNRIDNLREADHKLNSSNLSTDKRNTSGYKGVTWNKKDKKWRSKKNGKLLGSFDLIDDAIECRKQSDSKWEVINA